MRVSEERAPSIVPLRSLTMSVSRAIQTGYRSLSINAFAALVASTVLTGCFSFGNVEQGRVVAFDENARTFTMVLDVSTVAQTTDYSGLPAVTRQLPADKDEIGKLPVAGNLLSVDTMTHTLSIYDGTSQSIVKVSYQPVDEKKDVGAKNPLVYDAEQKKAKEFPVVDATASSVQMYLPDQKLLVTAGLSPEDIQRDPSAFRQGDAVRVYLKNPPETLRLMNVSKTDIFSK